MAAKVKALQGWCKAQCDGYRDVNITNMTSSWKSGLAFCAMIHRYRPDLIDYDSLSKENVFENNQLAFEVAERELNIPALLDAEDMVAMRVPDKLCIVTYVSQYYNRLGNKEKLGGPGVQGKVATKRPSQNAEPTSAPKKPLTSQTPSSQGEGAPKAVRRESTLTDQCSICRQKVYVMERHMDGSKLYHRRCIREQQRSQKSPTRKSPTEKKTFGFGSNGVKEKENQKPSVVTSTAKSPVSASSHFGGKQAVTTTTSHVIHYSTKSLSSVATTQSTTNTTSTGLFTKLNNAPKPYASHAVSSDFKPTSSSNTTTSGLSHSNVSKPNTGYSSQSVGVSESTESNKPKFQAKFYGNKGENPLRKPLAKSPSPRKEEPMDTASTGSRYEIVGQVVHQPQKYSEPSTHSHNVVTARTYGNGSQPMTAHVTKSPVKKAGDSQEDTQVLHGLLKNLAGVRSRQTPAANGTQLADHSPAHDKPTSTQHTSTLEEKPAFTKVVLKHTPKREESPPPLPKQAPPTLPTHPPNTPASARTTTQHDIPKPKQRQSKLIQDHLKVESKHDSQSKTSQYSPKSTHKDYLKPQDSKSSTAPTVAPYSPKSTHKDYLKPQDSKSSTAPTVAPYSPKSTHKDYLNPKDSKSSAAPTVAPYSPKSTHKDYLKPQDSKSSTTPTVAPYSPKSTHVSKLSSTSPAPRSILKNKNDVKQDSEKNGATDFLQRAPAWTPPLSVYTSKDSKGSLLDSVQLDSSDEFEPTSDRTPPVKRPAVIPAPPPARPDPKHTIHKTELKPTDIKEKTNKRTPSPAKSSWQIEMEARQGIRQHEPKSGIKTPPTRTHKTYQSDHQEKDSHKTTPMDTRPDWQIEAEKRQEKRKADTRAKYGDVQMEPEPVPPPRRKIAPPRPHSPPKVKSATKPEKDHDKSSRVSPSYGGLNTQNLAQKHTETKEDSSNGIEESPNYLRASVTSDEDPFGRTSQVRTSGGVARKPAFIIKEASPDTSPKHSPEANANRKPGYQEAHMEAQNDSPSSDDRPAWVIEAEKRKEARNGGYVDPEKQLIKRDPAPQGKRAIEPDCRFSFSYDFERSTVEETNGHTPEVTSEERPQGTIDMRNRPLPQLPSESPPKRRVNAEDRMAMHEIMEQLEHLDATLQILEEEGRGLEDKIRLVTDEAMDENELMVQWFEIVNQKNELVRKETDLMFKKKQQELEDEHEDIEYELRCLLQKPEYLKKPSEKVREESLLLELMDTVSQRNSIVDTIEENRKKYIEEDKEIAEVMAMRGFCTDVSPPEPPAKPAKHGKKKEKKKGKKHGKEKRHSNGNGLEERNSQWYDS